MICDTLRGHLLGSRSLGRSPTALLVEGMAVRLNAASLNVPCASYFHTLLNGEAW